MAADTRGEVIDQLRAAIAQDVARELDRLVADGWPRRTAAVSLIGFWTTTAAEAAWEAIEPQQ